MYSTPFDGLPFGRTETRRTTERALELCQEGDFRLSDTKKAGRQLPKVSATATGGQCR